MNGHQGPDGYQPQFSVTDNPVLLRRYGGTEPRNREAQLVRADGPDGAPPQLDARHAALLEPRDTRTVVTVETTPSFAWRDAAIGGGIGMVLSALMLAAWTFGRSRRLAHS